MNGNLPALSNEGGLSAYLEQIKKFPMLAAEEEYMLAKNWKTTGNVKAAEKLVTSHLRLVAKIAMGYRGYGLPVNEMISEGNVGLMQAVKKFEPEKGFRLATYAMWWIRASIQEYILRSWSLVKIGTTTEFVCELGRLPPFAYVDATYPLSLLKRRSLSITLSF